MNKKVLTILIITALAIIAGSFWFLQKGDVKEKNNVIPAEAGIFQGENQDTNINIIDNNNGTTTFDDKEKIEESQIIYNEDGTIDTSNWKTYRNEKYGFEVKLPVYVNEKNIDSKVLFRFSEKNDLSHVSINFSDTDPAWWERPDREFPTQISKVFESRIKNYDVVYYETFTMVINSSDMVSDGRKSILNAIIKYDDGYVNVIIRGINFEKLHKIMDQIILHMEINN